MANADSDSDPVVGEIYKIASTWTTNNSLTLPSLVTFTTHLMSVVQRLVGDNKGPYKKRVVLTVLRRVVDEADQSVLGEDSKVAIRSALDSIVPAVIDAAVGISVGDIQIKAVKALNALPCRCCKIS
jgi:hypothetical protein